MQLISSTNTGHENSALMHSIAQSCPSLCDPMDCGPPGSSVHGIFQAKYQSGLPFPPPRDISDPGTEHTCLGLAGGFFTTEPPGK